LKTKKRNFLGNVEFTEILSTSRTYGVNFGLILTHQNRCLRLITNAPWYIRNSTLYTDLQVPDVTTTLRQNYLNLQNTFVNHRNPLVQQILQNYPPHPINRRLKRKWHSDLRL
ncbi:hypothetical protein C0J52_13261, partial [Blattella germanica]